MAAAEFLGPLLGLGDGAVVDRDVVSALGLEVAGHRIAHDAQAQKCHLRHPVLLWRRLRARVADPGNVTRGMATSTHLASASLTGSRHPISSPRGPASPRVL